MRMNGTQDPFHEYPCWSKESWIYEYEMHNAAVKQLVPQHNLLVFKTGEGWERLCEFLDKPVPETPFPHLNIGGAAGNLVDQVAEFETLKKIKSEVISSVVFLSASVIGITSIATTYSKIRFRI